MISVDTEVSEDVCVLFGPLPFSTTKPETDKQRQMTQVGRHLNINISQPAACTPWSQSVSNAFPQFLQALRSTAVAALLWMPSWVKQLRLGLIIRVTWGLYRDNGREDGNYRDNGKELQG